MKAENFRNIILIDFEFNSKPGDLPDPICMVAKNTKTGKEHRIWKSELHLLKKSPFPTDPATLYVAYFSSAEWSCFLALGWPLPESIIDLYAEYACLTNGKKTRVKGKALLDALNAFGFEGIEVAEKGKMRELALRGGEYTEQEKQALLDYCASDVYALEKLLPQMLPLISIDHALLRGRYMKAVAHMEHVGVPIDVTSLETLRENFSAIKSRLIEKIDQEFGVYEGGSFRYELFANFLAKNEISWPRLDTGRLNLSSETFKDMSHSYPLLLPLHELRQSLSQLRLNDLQVGSDGRNRCLLSPFRSKTGRNQPSNSKFIFGASRWIRGLIQPKRKLALAYVDFSQQEFGIGAALSGDKKMMEAYQADDPYLTFAKQAGAVPADATKESHKAVRDQYKAIVLAVQYGMGAESLACRIGKAENEAQHLLNTHKRTYPIFWKWSDSVVDFVMLNGFIQTTFGWTHFIDAEPNARSLRNFPMQANGAEILRLTCIAATEEGIRVCAPVHDALLVEAIDSEIESAVERVKAIMAQASAVVLDGFILKSEAEIVRYPNRLIDERGQKMWDMVWLTIYEPNVDPSSDSGATPMVPQSDNIGSIAHTPPVQLSFVGV